MPHRLLTHRGIDRVQGVVMYSEDLVQGVRQVLEQMEAVCPLGGRGRPPGGPPRHRGSTIPRDHLHAWVLPKPLGHRLGGAIREERHGLAACQADQDGARGLAFAQRPVIHPQHPGCGQDGQRHGADRTQQRVPAHGQVPLVAQTHPGCAPQRHAEGDEALGEPQRAPGLGDGHRRQPFRKEAARTVAIAAEPLAHPEL